MTYCLCGVCLAILQTWLKLTNYFFVTYSWIIESAVETDTTGPMVMLENNKYSLFAECSILYINWWDQRIVVYRYSIFLLAFICLKQISGRDMFKSSNVVVELIISFIDSFIHLAFMCFDSMLLGTQRFRIDFLSGSKQETDTNTFCVFSICLIIILKITFCFHFSNQPDLFTFVFQWSLIMFFH